MEKDVTKPLQKQNTKKLSGLKSFIATILWFLIWPLPMGAIAIGLAVLLSTIFFGAPGNTGGSGAINRAYLAFFGFLMGLVCLLVIKLQKRSKSFILQIGATVLRGYMLIGLFGVALLVVFTSDPAPATSGSGINVQQSNTILPKDLQHDPKIVGTMQQIGASQKSIDEIDERYVAQFRNPKLENQGGYYQAVLGPTGQLSYGMLTIKQGLDPSVERTVIAHEYLHHVWYALLDLKTRESLESDLISMYGRDPWMQERVKGYIDVRELQPTELFSYYCTESSEGYITSFVLTECNKYINRSSLALIR
jgi:hypothetical protein